MDLIILQKNQSTQPKSMFDTKNEDIGHQESHHLCFMIFRHNQLNPSLKNIFSLKQLFSKCLPKMSKQHILNTILDKDHFNLVMIRDRKQLIGATTFRLFKNNGFNEIVFFAIKTKYQGEGYGTKLMSALKNEMLKIGVRNLLTYADDLAHKFFYRQGFSQNITLSTKQFQSLIKKYEGGTLMHCFIQVRVKELQIHHQQKIIEQNHQKPKIIEQNQQKIKLNQQNLSKPQKKEKINNVIKIFKKQKKQNKEQVQDQNSLLRWFKKAQKSKAENQNDK